MLRTLGTAGHIDHGKTALVEALTGRNTDRLEEERRRGISIELGYALLDLGDGLELSIVDVPGHERFVRTMVAGATGIDLALVCVACDDGVMPQTREHLAILEVLGVDRGVVALTKRDLVDDEGASYARLDVEEALVGTLLEGSAMVEVSVRDGRGLDALRSALRLAATGDRARPHPGRTRMPIDRTFSLRGIGTVVTGTLWSGTISVGDQVEIRPQGLVARVRSLQAHDRDVERADAGGRVAACLVGIERADVVRGAILVVGPPPPVSYRLDVELATVPGGRVRSGDLVEVLHGTAAVHARVVAFPTSEVGPGERSLAQLRLDAPLATLRGDRLVVRSLGPPDTVAGGVVLDPRPPRHAGSGSAIARLTALRDGSPEAVVQAAARGAPVRVRDLVDAGLLDPAPAREAVERAIADDRLTDLGAGYVLGAETYAERAATVATILAERARTSPLAPGLPLGRVVGEAPWRDALASRLEADRVLERVGAQAIAPGLRGTSEAVAGAADALVAALAAEPFAPPRLADALAAIDLPTATRAALVAVHEQEGRIVRRPDGLAITRAAYDEALAIVEAACASAGTVTLAQLRDATGSSRKYAQAILERFDGDGVTRRVGDHRVLRRRRSAPGQPGLA